MKNPNTLEEELKAYLGLPPHNTPGNFLWCDPYYIADIRKRHGDQKVNEALKRLRTH